MRLFELLESIEILDEVNMSPSALADFAKSKFAQSMTAGFEAELIVPGAASDDEDEMEPDYEMDERVTSTDSIRDFFLGDYNGSRQVDRAIESIDESFFEYADQRLRDDFDNDERDDMIRQILKDDDKTPEEIEEIMGSADSKEYYEAENTAWEEYRDNADYDQYTTKFFRSHYPYMSDIANSFHLDWPHYTSGGNSEGDSAEEVAREIEDAIGMKVKASGGYHGAKRGPGFFILEPDSSINTDEGAGLELVSPPMPLNQAFEYLDKVFAWAKTRGCITDDSTGFHMGISIPDQTRENVDHLKFTLFLGDEYVLKQFGRESNSYTKSMMQEIAKKVRNLGAGTGSGKMTPESILKTFKAGLDSTAAKFIKTSLTTTHDRYVTVNIKDNYIEVRSAGGDYLDYGVEKIKNTLMRYVRAMGAAADPEAEKQEYAKKLYKFLSPMVKGEEDIIKYFAQYSAGTLPATALKSFVRKVQRDRAGKTAMSGEDSIGEGPNLYLYNYYPVDGSVGMSSVNVRGTSRRDATAAFREKFGETGYNIHSIKDIEIKDDTGANGYQIVSMNGNTIARIFADSEQEAILMARARTRRAAMNDDEWQLRGPNGRYVDMAGSDSNSNSAADNNTYRITDNNGSYLATITAGNPMDAYTQAIQRATAAGVADGSWKLIAPSGRQIYPDPAFGPTASGENRYIVTYTNANGGSTMTPRVMATTPQRAAEQILTQHPGSQVTNVQDFASGGLGPNLLRSNSGDDIPEIPGEFVADPMASGAQDYVVKFVDPDGAVQRTTVRANTAVQAREWFEENHPRTYHITDVWQQH